MSTPSHRLRLDRRGRRAAGLADRVAGGPAGEDIEVYVARGDETEVRAYDGEVESLTSADSRRRHPASSGASTARPPARLRLGRLARARCWPRPWPRPGTTPASPRRTPTSCWPGPTGWPPSTSTCGTTASARDADDDKVALALELERATRAADPRIRQVVVGRLLRRAGGGGAGLDHRDPVLEPQDVGLPLGRGHRRRRRRHPDRQRVQRGPGLRRPRPRRGHGRCRPPGRPHARAPPRAPRAAARWSSTPGWSPPCCRWCRRPCRARRWSRAGRSSPAGSASRWPTPPSPWSTTRPTPGPTARRRYDAEGLACRRNVLIADGVLRHVRLRHGVGPPGRDAVDRFGRAGRVRRHAGGRLPGPGPRPRDRGLRRGRVLAAVGDGLYVQSVTGIHSGVNPVSGDFSVGAEGLMIRDGALAEPVREVTVASTLQRMLQSVVAIGGDVGGSRASPPARPWPSPTCSSAAPEPGLADPSSALLDVGGGLGAGGQGARCRGVVDRTGDGQAVRTGRGGCRRPAGPQRGTPPAADAEADGRRSCRLRSAPADAVAPKDRTKVWITNRRGKLSRPLTKASIWP